MRLRVGLVGLGSAWDSRHRPALRALADRFEVRAVCDPVARRAELAAAEFEATAVDGFQVLSRREDVDAVLLLSTGWFGWLPVLACCDAGKAVYCAEALNLDLDQAQLIRRRVEEAGIAFVPELPNRLCPATLRLKELIATHLGPPNLLFCHRRQSVCPTNEQADGWGQRDLIELIDWCRYVVGVNARSVLGIAHEPPANPGHDDYLMMSLEFLPDQRGAAAVAQISCGRYVPTQWKEAISFRPAAELQVSCENGIAFIDMPNTLIWFDEAGRHMESLDHDRPVGEQLLLDFNRAATSLVRDITGLEDAYRALNIALRAKRSHAEGRRIQLDD